MTSRQLADPGDAQYDAGYTAALLQLRARITTENPKPTLGIQKVLTHIQDLLGRCEQCGSWVYADKSCLTCEMAEKRVKKKTSKRTK